MFSSSSLFSMKSTQKAIFLFSFCLPKTKRRLFSNILLQFCKKNSAFTPCLYTSTCWNFDLNQNSTPLDGFRQTQASWALLFFVCIFATWRKNLQILGRVIYFAFNSEYAFMMVTIQNHKMALVSTISLSTSIEHPPAPYGSFITLLYLMIEQKWQYLVQALK